MEIKMKMILEQTKRRREMEQSYLIQRLLRPYKAAEGEKQELFHKLGEAFSFGGGLRNGGLREEAMKLLRPIFRFDYMGSAEFEFGAVPQALAKIYEGCQDDTYGSFRIPVKYNYKDYYEGETRSGIADVYIICNKADELGVINIINKFANKEKEVFTKETVNLDKALANGRYTEDLAGWLELDNGYMFFKDKEMYDKVVKLFFEKVEKKEVAKENIK